MADLPLDLIKQLYYKEGLSTIEIAKKLNVTPWVIIKFMKRMGLPRRTFSEANIERFRKQPTTFSLKQNLSSQEEKLKIAGIMLYWAEGSKPNPTNRMRTVDFVNSNPRMIKLFLRFLREICGIDERRLRLYLYCYANQKPENLKRYWHRVTNIPLTQFTKPYIREDFLPEKRGKMRYGLVHIRYSDKKLLSQIERWIEEYLKICKI